MTFFSHILNILFPSKCPICAKTPDSYLYNPVCTDCWNTIERYHGPSCSICGIPTISPFAKNCESCLRETPPFSQILYYGIYEGALKEAIHILKFNGIKRLSKPLSHLLLKLPIPSCDAIIPVPLHKNRLMQREFNQTAAIGIHLSRALGIPLSLNTLIKIKDTPPQTETSGRERILNIKDAFFATKEIKGLNVLLVDDVITTGSTVKECSETLKKAGAKSVTIVALARSLPKWNT